MMRRNGLIGFGAGVLAGAVGMMALTGGHAVPRALGQVLPPPVVTVETPVIQPQPVQVVAAPAGAASPRYQITSWAHPAAYAANGAGNAASHGAYVLDSQNGDVWRINEHGEYKKLRKVEAE